LFVRIDLRWGKFFLLLSHYSQLFSFCYCNYYNRAPRGYDYFHDLWNEIARSSEEEAGNFGQGPTKIASVPLSYYKPEEISLEVDNEKVILHSQHQFEQ